MSEYFVNRFLVSIVAAVMLAIYIFYLKSGMTTAACLLAASLAGFAAGGISVACMTEWNGRCRMANPIAVWTMVLIVFAPLGPAVFADAPPLSRLTVVAGLIVTFTVIAAVASAYLLEQAIVGEQRGPWDVEYGVLALGVVFAAWQEIGGHHGRATIVLTAFWCLHFFFKQVPGLVKACIRPRGESG